MAVKQKKTQNAKGGNELLENPEALAERLSRTEDFLEKNKKLVFGIGGVLVLIVAGFFAYKTYMNNQNQEAQTNMFQAIYYFEADSLNQALNGDGNYPGFLEIIDDYSGTDAANLAHYYAGVAYLKQGEFNEAIEHLQEFSSDDLLVQARAYALIGDAYMELEDYATAAEFYDKAANYKPNEFFTPLYLSQAGFAYELAGNLEAALSRYTEITEKYVGANEYENARKQKARLEAMASN
ncbi:tetratricopeptide repeat protein [Nafulsella turpanensis]|uniref:tetratricopeptide repeat protein n=1 Tax=Nafulsella turpanensis TaxID=1265690 RepID=UPI00034B047A|nr:tetratricopeptide repeat protein [Nafulsella turpanensis]